MTSGAVAGLFFMGAMGWVCQWNLPDDSDLNHWLRRITQFVSGCLMAVGAVGGAVLLLA